MQKFLDSVIQKSGKIRALVRDIKENYTKSDVMSRPNPICWLVIVLKWDPSIEVSKFLTGVAIHVLGKPKSWRTNWPKWMPNMTLAMLSWQRAKSRVSLQRFQASFGFNPDTYKHFETAVAFFGLCIYVHGAANLCSVLKVCGSGNHCHEHSDICVGSLCRVLIMPNQKTYIYIYMCVCVCLCVCVQHAFLFMPIPYIFISNADQWCSGVPRPVRRRPKRGQNLDSPLIGARHSLRGYIYSHTESTVNARIWLRGAKKYEKKDEVAGSSKDKKDKKDKKDHKEKENATKRKREKSPAPDAENKPRREKKMKKSKK